MYPQNRKQQQRIAKRTVKIQKMIKEQEVQLDTLDPSDFPSHKDYLQAVSIIRKKLSHLGKELVDLEAGKMPGAGS